MVKKKKLKITILEEVLYLHNVFISIRNRGLITAKIIKIYNTFLKFSKQIQRKYPLNLKFEIKNLPCKF